MSSIAERTLCQARAGIRLAGPSIRLVRAVLARCCQGAVKDPSAVGKVCGTAPATGPRARAAWQVTQSGRYENVQRISIRDRVHVAVPYLTTHFHPGRNMCAFLQ